MRSFKTILQVTTAVLIARVIFAQDIIHPGQSTRGAGPERAVALNNGFIVTFAPGTSKTARALAALQAGAQVRYNYDNLAAISIAASSNAVNARLPKRRIRCPRTILMERRHAIAGLAAALCKFGNHA